MAKQSVEDYVASDSGFKNALCKNCQADKHFEWPSFGPKGIGWYFVKGSLVVCREVAQMPKRVLDFDRGHGSFAPVGTLQFRSYALKALLLCEGLRPDSMALAKCAI